MERVTFFIGLNDKDSKRQELTTVDAFRRVENIFDTLCPGGATVRECRGLYRHEDGSKVIENTLEAFTLDINEETIAALVTALKGALNQESIMVVREPVNIYFM